jgi:glycosyltransferase involved in cell wall biosynthesis
MRLVWNAIVKNEAAILERCVKSLLPHVTGAVVVDTGSTDGTPDKLNELFAAAGKPLELSSAPFVNFSQARNAALGAAREFKLDWDYLLLADADMELKVLSPDWINGVKGLAYDIRQTAGALGYYNRRLLSRHAAGWYVGVTHEYLDVASAGVLDGAVFVDHVDGANRSGKFKRDIALLERALPIETDPGLIERYHFYLAGSYFDLGDWGKAAHHYAKRVTLGGFEEERWYAQMRLALCYGNMGDDKSFLWEMLAAYQMRPQRAETLYELAKFYRARGGGDHVSLLFSEAGLALPHVKTDLLFVNDWVYKSGLSEEFAICAYYDARRRASGAKAADRLSLTGSEQARYNLFWYLRPLVEHVPSFRPTRLAFDAPPGYVATNPSIATFEGRPVCLVRTVNYTITPEGRYAIRNDSGDCNDRNPIHTRNYLGFLTDDLEIAHSYELALPYVLPKPPYDRVRGFEDSRLFEMNGRLQTISTVRELNPEGWCEQVIASVTDKGYGVWKKILPKERRNEKNWMPWVQHGRLLFVYRLGTLVDVDGRIVRDHDCELAVGNISGGSQVIDAGGSFLALVHEARPVPGRPNRYYQHRFVSLSDAGELLGISPPFVFHDKQIEFAVGLIYLPAKQQLVASYGVRDCEAWLATMDLDEVLDFIDKGQL